MTIDRKLKLTAFLLPLPTFHLQSLPGPHDPRDRASLDLSLKESISSLSKSGVSKDLLKYRRRGPSSALGGRGGGARLVRVRHADAESHLGQVVVVVVGLVVVLLLVVLCRMQ